VNERLGEAVIAVVRMPDGRWAVRNERDLSDLTADDEDAMADALLLWFEVRRAKRGMPE
jgi:hypothetical protein